jgi:hypothetical protein
MSTLEKVEKLLKIGGAVYAAFVGIATFLVFKNVDDVSHFALYLVSQTWVELAAAAAVYLLVRAHRDRVVELWRTLRLRPYEFRGTSALGLILLVAAFAAFLAAGGRLLRARADFWGGACRAAYAYHNSVRVVILVQSGRVADAYQLARTTQNALKGAAESGYVDRRLIKLTGALQRSEQLARQVAGGAWNPISDRGAYFAIAEAVRVNPQNYGAADKLHAMLQPLVNTYLPVDAVGICAPGFSVGNFRGRATSILEAQRRRASASREAGLPCRGDTSACGDAEKRFCQIVAGELQNAWAIDLIQRTLKTSDNTRSPPGR